MRVHKATLIQDVTDYLVIIRQSLTPLLEAYSREGKSEEDILKWVIEEELEIVYHLFAIDHMHSAHPYEHIHCILNRTMAHKLSMLTAHYVMAPLVYTDYNEIKIKLVGNDLWIEYFTDSSYPTPLIGHYGTKKK